MEYEILKQRSKNLAYEVVNLNRCEDEPIANCGAIQPSGLLMVVDSKTHEIRAASRNWEKVLNLKTSEMLGQSVDRFLHYNPVAANLCEAINKGLTDIKVLHSSLRLSNGICYNSESNIIIEFEFEDSVYRIDIRAPLKNFVRAMRENNSIEEVCQQTAQTIREMSGFDRVMIYRFDSEWNGEVIAEAKVDFLDPFLHLKYPAFDIPPQARQLFFQNQSRMIVSIEAEPEPILTKNFHPGEIDLSNSLLRAVSPIHIQYLSNMGVSASFSAPIKVSDRLWGLIACHHYSGPMHPSSETRYMFELASQITSGKVADLLDRKRLQIKADTLLLTQSLLSEVASGASVPDALKSRAKSLLDFTQSSGAFVRIGDDTFSFGYVPQDEILNKILDHLQATDQSALWNSNCLSRTLDAKPNAMAAGALAVPLSVNFDDLIIWFRPEEVQEVRWGGKPQNKESAHQNTLERLSPRSSFAEWREKLEDHSRLWSQSDLDFAQYFQLGFVQGLFAKARALSTAYIELERVTKSKDEFIGTVSHELRTPLSIIVGWISILKDYPQNNPEAEEAIKIIERNAKIQIKLIDDLLDASRIIAGKLRLNLEPHISINQVISNVVESLLPTAQAKSIALTVRAAEEINLPADPDRLRQVVWNLLTNSIKFTGKGGKVAVSFEKKNSACVITVEDNGIGIDPLKLSVIFDRFAQARSQSASIGGLGLGLSIVKSIVEMHGGNVRAYSEGEGKGTKFVINLPVYALNINEAESEKITAPVLRPSRSHRLAGLKILVVEDQDESQRGLKILIERESAVVTTANNGIEGLKALKAQKFDLILSDIGMPEMDGYQMIAEWRKEELKFNLDPIPAIALTAYATPKDRTLALQAGFQSHIAKPIDQQELLAVIDSVSKPVIDTNKV